MRCDSVRGRTGPTKTVTRLLAGWQAGGRTTAEKLITESLRKASTWCIDGRGFPKATRGRTPDRDVGEQCGHTSVIAWPLATVLISKILILLFFIHACSDLHRCGRFCRMLLLSRQSMRTTELCDGVQEGAPVLGRATRKESRLAGQGRVQQRRQRQETPYTCEDSGR